MWCFSLHSLEFAPQFQLQPSGTVALTRTQRMWDAGRNGTLALPPD